MALSTQRASAFHPSADRSAPPQWNYDVFLSFRGVDTRNGILSHLYHELQNRCIKTFMDDPKLERGTTISSELFKAIQESRLAIVVLSPNYASSSWCLDELTKILQCMKSNGTVLPVFYNVDPSDVRKHSGSFADAFTKRWRDALTEVANLAGIDSKNQCERKLIEKIVEWVWRKVHRTFKLLDSTELVGIKFTREQMDLLVASTDDVRFVGIWGMGGIGKTTIARLVYESISFHFEVPCFLANFREASEGNRLVDLQRQLLFPILKKQITQVLNEDWGTHFIKSCLCNKKVLLILDDVNASSQLEKFAKEKDWFGKGSIIIITTRDERLVKKHDMEISYKVEGLDDDEALELFSLNAFKKFEPEEGFWELSKCFVNYAGGLPIALKILGCSVYKRDRDEWESQLDKLHKIPESTIVDLLKITYDRLDEMSQNIFLDVAFFHKGNSKEEVVDSYGKCGLIMINELIEKSLLTIDISNIVDMHDLIQEMAFEIVRRESPKEPGRRSRLCRCDDIIHVIEKNSATNKIQVIALSMIELEKADWNWEALSKMINLKYLKVDNVIISSIPRILRNSLRILKWKWYSSKYLPSNFQLNNLVSLEMQGSQLVRLWDERIELDLNDCGLCDIPDDIGCLSSLEKLNLSRNNFVSLPASIGSLSKLVKLWVNGCQMLQQLPHLRLDFSIFGIYTDDCASLKILPKLSIKNGSRFFMLGCVNSFALVENSLDWNSIILGMLANTRAFLQVPTLTSPMPNFQFVIPGRRIPEWFNKQSVGDSLIVELPPCTTPIWIAFCVVIEDDHPNPPHDLYTIFRIECTHGYGVTFAKGHLVSPHLWVSCVYYYISDEECSQMKISFQSYYSNGAEPAYCSGIKECGFRLVHKQDVEEFNQIMIMNHSINISTKATSPHNSAYASASSHQKSLCRKSYALSKGFLTKLVKIFSLFLTTAVFIKSFNNSKQWGCIGLLIWRVTTLISYLGLAPSYFELLLKNLIKTVILKRAAKFLPTLLKTPPLQMSTHKYLKG
ncbi:unnamed protein product [Prunus brigantina]